MVSCGLSKWSMCALNIKVASPPLPFDLAAEIFGDFLFLAGDADDVGEITGQLDNPVAVYLFEHCVFHVVSFSSKKYTRSLFCSTIESGPTTMQVDARRRFA